MTGRSDWKHLVAIFVVALVARLGMVAWFEERGPAKLPDEQEYLAIAQVLTFSEEHEYQSPMWDRLIDVEKKEMKKERVLFQAGDMDLLVENTPGAQRFMQKVPMYPLVIAAVMRITGNDDADAATRIMRVIQAVMGAITAVMVFVLAGQFFAGRGRLWAGWIAAIYPPWLWATGLLLTETMFTMLLVICWYLAARLLEKTRARDEKPFWGTATIADVLVLGLLAAAAVMTKASALGLFAALAVVMVALSGWRLRAVAAMAGVLLVLAVGMSPWVARNYQITKEQNEAIGRPAKGDFVPTTCSVGKSLYEAVGPEADGGPAMEKIAVPATLGPMTEHEVDRYYWNAAVKYMKENRWRTVKLAGVKFLRTWSITPNFKDYRSPLFMVVSVISVAPLLLLALWGWWAARREVRDWILVLLPVACFTATHMVFVGSVRYREPAMGFVMMLAGVGIVAIFGGKKTGSEVRNQEC